MNQPHAGFTFNVAVKMRFGIEFAAKTFCVEAMIVGWTTDQGTLGAHKGEDVAYNCGREGELGGTREIP